MNDGSVPTCVIIADDHALVRGGIAMLVNIISEKCNIIETNSYDRTIAALSETDNVDLVLFDLFMPGSKGIDGIRHICSKWPDVPIVLVTVEENSATIHKALQAGASGYIPKSSTPQITMSAIRLVLSGGIYLPPSALNTAVGTSAQTEGTLLPNQSDQAQLQANSKLTKRQCEVLDLISLGKSNKAIAEELGLTPGTIKMHMSRIFKVLDVSNRTEAARKYLGR